jgi:hypothetical protein
MASCIVGAAWSDDVAEVFREWVFEAPDGTRYLAYACGVAMPDGLWQGWIEFAPIGGGDVLRSSRETTQPNRVDAVYWASGLTAVYLEGAFRRVLDPFVVSVALPLPQPAYDGPAPTLLRRKEDRTRKNKKG